MSAYSQIFAHAACMSLTTANDAPAHLPSGPSGLSLTPMNGQPNSCAALRSLSPSPTCTICSGSKFLLRAASHRLSTLVPGAPQTPPKWSLHPSASMSRTKGSTGVAELIQQGTCCAPKCASIAAAPGTSSASASRVCTSSENSVASRSPSASAVSSPECSPRSCSTRANSLKIVYRVTLVPGAAVRESVGMVLRMSSPCSKREQTSRIVFCFDASERSSVLSKSKET